MKRIFSVVFLLTAIGGFAYAFLKIAVVNGPFMIVVAVSTFLTLISGMLAGLGQGSADLSAARLRIKELTDSVATLTDANEGIKAQFEAKVTAALDAFKAGYKAGPGAPAPTPAPSNGAGHVAQG